MTVHAVARAESEHNKIIELINRISLLTKIVRIMAYVLRFCYHRKRSGLMVVTLQELKCSFLKLVQSDKVTNSYDQQVTNAFTLPTIA